MIESDQIGLEDRAYEVIPKSKRRDQERLLENKRRQGKLLLVSLLDNFCLLYDQSPERNRKLFYGEWTLRFLSALTYGSKCMMLEKNCRNQIMSPLSNSDLQDFEQHGNH